MRQHILATALAAAVTALAYGQNLNPTVEVTNAYEGGASSINKPAQQMAVPDSVTRFNLDFDYSVFEKPYQDKSQKTRGEMRIDMFVSPHVDWAGFKTGFRHLKRIFDPGETPVYFAHFLVAHFQFACDDGVVAVIFLLFFDLL